MSQALPNITVWRERGGMCGEERPILEFRKGFVVEKPRKVCHGDRTVEQIQVGVGEIEAFQEEELEIARTIGLHFNPHGVAFVAAAQFLFNGA